MSRFIATDIEWDVDCAEDLKSLPETIELPNTINPENSEEIGDYITDLTGFCHKGFALEEK